MSEEKPARKLPMAGWWPFGAGVLAGIVLRTAIFAKASGPFATMAMGFVYFAPAVVAAVTVYAAERREPRSWSYYAWAGGLANVLFVLGSLVILIEGVICALLIIPLFAFIGALAGLLMGAVCRVGRWTRQALYSVSLLPLAVAAIDPQLPAEPEPLWIERTQVIRASPHDIWNQLENARDIQPGEVGRAWMYRIGSPLPTEGVTERQGGTIVRHVRMGRGVRFDQVAVDWQPGKLVRWKYRFSEDSFPPGSLDDHVRIGGEYFDLQETTYTLSPAGDGATALSIRMQYRVNTQFNWYAKPIANFLIGNFCDVILDFYARRAEQARSG